MPVIPRLVLYILYHIYAVRQVIYIYMLKLTINKSLIYCYTPKGAKFVIS